jgi:hypothetical protein
VNLTSNTTTFTGVPDIPLTDLAVTLSGGPDAVFMTTCASPSGTATATLTTQNGDRTASPTSAFTVANCTAPAGGAKPGGGTGRKPSGGRRPARAGRPRIVLGSFAGLKDGKPTLAFGLVAGTKAPRLSSFAVALPTGLRFAGRRRAGRLTVAGVTLQGAKVGSISLAHGHLTITLRRAVSSLIVEIRHQGLAESHGLRVKAKHRRLRSLRLTVSVRDAKRKLTTLTASITRLGL